MSAIPASDPVSEATTSTAGTACQPRKAPIMASSFTSPYPIPSTPVHRSYPQATVQRTPPPMSTPSSASAGAMRPGRKALARPTTMPGRLTSSGMKRWSRSMKVISRSAAENANTTAPAGVAPKRQSARRASAPVAASTSG